MTYRVLIVDDEPLARERLQRLLHAQPNFTVVAMAEHGEAALHYLQQQAVDLVLLDIQMPGLDGLQVAAQIQQLAQVPQIIFCTAYDEHAIAAFKVNAVDYLLKPVRPEELAQALQRSAERLASSNKTAAEESSYLVASGHRGIERIALEHVLACVAEQKYVQVLHQQGSTLIDGSLKQLEQEFSDYFIRSHRGALVAKDKIQRLQSLPDGSHQLWLHGLSQPIAVSRRHLGRIKEWLVRHAAF